MINTCLSVVNQSVLEANSSFAGLDHQSERTETEQYNSESETSHKNQQKQAETHAAERQKCRSEVQSHKQ